MKLKTRFNKQYTQISIYVIITAIIIYCLSLVAKSAPSIIHTAIDKLLWLLKVIKPVIIGFIFAYLFEPIVDLFERRYKKLKIFQKKQNSCRMYAVVTTVTLIILIFATLISLLAYSITDQLRFVNLDDLILVLNQYVENFLAFFNSLATKLTSLNIQSEQLAAIVKDAGQYITRFVQSFASNAGNYVGNFSGSLTSIIFGLIIGVYFLIDGKMMKAYVSKVFEALFSDGFNRRIRGFVKDADIVFSGYIRGQLMDAFVMMMLISLTLSIVGVKFAIVIGVLAGFGNLIPYFGPIVAYVGTALVCLISGEYKQMIIAIIALVVIQAIDGNIIGPKLLSHSIKVHPLLIIVSLIFGSAIGGFAGMLLAVPVGALIKVLFNRYINKRLEIKGKLIVSSDNESLEQPKCTSE